MPKCKKVQRQDLIVCAGSLTKPITIYTRNITPPELNGVDFDEEFVEPRNVMAMIETIKGESIFAGSNIRIDVTHQFTFRYIAGITFEKYVIYGGNRYSILDVENQNEMNKFYVLRCSNRGLSNLPVTEI